MPPVSFQISGRKAGPGGPKDLTRILLAVALVAGSLAVQAAPPLPLLGRDINGNPVPATAASAVFEYDPNLDITWLRDWNANGQQNWAAQTAWAASLTYFGGGWRLPTTTVPDPTCDDAAGYGLNCLGSEMGNLYNGQGFTPANPGPFINMQSDYYWSGTEDASDTNGAWIFSPSFGGQGTNVKTAVYYAVAVRSGDVVPPPPPPIPTLSQWSLGALALLLALSAVARRRAG